MKYRTNGFIMMEVLIALVLVTTLGIAIVLWAENSLHSITRLHDEYERMRAVRLAQNWIRTLPNSTDVKGEAKIGAWKIIWQRRKLDENPATGYPLGYGIHDILLFEYNYQVYQTQEESHPWFSDTAITTMYRKTRGDTKNVLPF